MACEDVRRTISERDGRVLRSRRVRSHLRDCSTCASFAAAISERRSDLQAIAPLLPAAASAALLARLGTSASLHSGSGAVGGTGVAGQLGTTALATKAAVGVTVVVTAAAGLGALPKVLPLHAHRSTPSAPATLGHGAATAGAAVGAASGHRVTVTAPGAPSRPIASPPAAPVPRSHRHHVPPSTRHGGHGGEAHAAAPASAVIASPAAASTPASVVHGKSALPHGKSSQAPGHTRVTGAGAQAAHPAKPAHSPPGQTGTAGKSASSPGHYTAGSSRPAKANPMAAATTTSSDVASTSPPRGPHAK